VRGSHKDGVTANAVHVDACAGLNVIQVDVAIFGDQVNDIIFGSNLDRNPNALCVIHGQNSAQTCMATGKSF
jgi:hypothetical protein